MSLENPKNPFFILILFALGSISIYLYLQMKDYKAIVQNTSVNSNSSEDIKPVIIQNRKITYHFLGHPVELSESMELLSEAASELPPKGAHVVFVFNELSCNVCKDDETQFGNKIVETYGVDRAYAVVYSKNKRYSMNYIRMNQTKFPVYYDTDSEFHKLNHIEHTPLILLVEDGRVLASHYPIPGHLDLCEPFHQFVMAYLEKQKNNHQVDQPL